MQEKKAGPVKILGISGSPRSMATEWAVQEALKIAHERYDAETGFFSVKGMHLEFCVHCDFCVRTKKGCIHKDAVSSELYAKILWADAWIMGTPVYQGTVSAQIKTIMDRCRAIVAQDRQALRNKVGMGIAVGGDRAGGQEPALQTIAAFYIINEMIPVSGGSFGANLGGTFWSKDNGAEGASQDEAGVRSLEKTLARLIRTVRIISSAATEAV